MSANPIYHTSSFEDFNEYKQIFDFISQRNTLTLAEFERAIINDINLFAIPQDYNFEVLNASLNEIVKVLPNIKNIFSRPITHIKNESEILPVEAVKSISNETVSHISVHSEFWQNIENGSLLPHKLLSQNYIDNYAIYENVIFTRLIDYILLFINQNINFLNNVLYSNRDLHFNLLERENHLSYFLALGKLHTGYVRDNSKYGVICETCLEKLKFINRVLKPYLSKPVYKRCKKVTAKMTLRKTNIFRNDKDYGRIYKLIKYFALKENKISNSLKADVMSVKNEGYFHYCTLITIFGISHFNFNFSENTIFDFKKLNADATFKEYSLKIETVNENNINALKISVKRNTLYSIVLIPEVSHFENNELFELAKQTFNVNEIHILSSFRENNETIFLSPFDIESFRKIQQLVLKAMVYSDSTYDFCPFCGENLKLDGNKYFCKFCRTEIAENTCPETEHSYKSITISNLKVNHLEQRKDALMHFRNITEISPAADIVCPYCKQIHYK